MCAQAAHGASWVLLFVAAWSQNLRNPFYGFAWIHTVALGWVTMAALAILLHALPAFIDSPWRWQTVSRWSIAAFAAGVALLVLGFFRGGNLIAAGAVVTALALFTYLAGAFATIGDALAAEGEDRRVERAVARAFGGTFAFLGLTALLGLALGFMLAGIAVPAFFAALPGAHAIVGTLGWLSLLIFGVSMRTLRPITGVRTRIARMHVLVGGCCAIGVPLLAIGLALPNAPCAWIGGSLFAAAALGYAFDVLDIIRRAENPHRPPQAFVVSGIAWLLAALALGGGVLAGKPWGGAYVFALLMGWIGQFVNAHMYHIGIRLLATVYRGDEDETPPQALLESRLSWYSFLALQLAVAVVIAALLRDDAGLAARGAVFGLIGWIAIIANVFADSPPSAAAAAIVSVVRSKVIRAR